MKVQTSRSPKRYWLAFVVLWSVAAASSCSVAEVATTTSARSASPTPAPHYDRDSQNISVSPTPGVGSGSNSGGDTRSLKLTSKLMNRDMPYRVVLPAGYQTKSAERYAVVYLLHGLTGHFNDWTDRAKIDRLASQHNFILVTPEGNDGWYTDSPNVADDKYESYIIKELIPEIDRGFRTIPDRAHRVIAGLSMGGYGAVKYGLKFPEMFSLAGSFSGAFGISEWSEKAGGNKLIGKSVDAVFGPVNSEARKANDIFGMVRELTAAKLNTLPFFYLSCGTEDIMFKTNNEFVALLKEKNVPHDYRTRKGIHDWVFWGGEIIQFLDLADSRLNGKKNN
jgi:putative tributyrin esterase